MKLSKLFLTLACTTSFCLCVANEAEVTPVQKVLQLLNGMLSKGKKMKEEEQVQFAAYKTWCEDTTSEKQQDIADAEEAIVMMKAEIEKLTSDAAMLTKDIAQHDEDISVWNGNMKAATAVRDMEKTDYDALHKDYSESISALQRAIEVLSKPAKNTPQASMVQVSVSALQRSSLIPEHAKKVMQAFLQEFPTVDLQVELGAVSAPEAAGYEFQSQGIIEMLEKLLDKFTQELTAIEKKEMNAQHEFEMLIKDMTMQITDATATRDEKIEIKAKKLEKKAKTEADLKETTAAMEADKKYLAEVTATCQQKSTDFQSRQELRTDEIAAIEKAIEIMSSDDMTKGETRLPTLVQVKSKGASFAQLRSSREEQDIRTRLTDFLRSEAKTINSRVLMQVVQHAQNDPFAKVKTMIKDLIARLMSEAAEEAEHKSWCDEELSTNEQTRNQKTAAVEALHAEIDQLEASIAKLTEQLAELAKAIAELDAAMAKATNLRQEEKAENTQVIADGAAAQDAVARAIVVLKEFYAKAGESTALLQKQPAIFDSPYKGMQSENGGVVGMLEVIESDFARLQAETKAEEATAQKEYEEFMATSKEDKAAKERESEHKTAKKQDEEQMLTVKLEDLDGTQKELDAALQYFDKLKPSCIDSGVSYDDRVARRKEEIASLQEALKILNGDAI